MWALGFIAFILGLIGLIRPTLMHQAVKIGRIHFAKRRWNLGLFVLALFIMAVFAYPSHFLKDMKIDDENKKLTYQWSELEEEVKKLTDECKECEEEEKKQLAELERLEKELTAIGEEEDLSDTANVNPTPPLQKPAAQQSAVQATSNMESPTDDPSYRGTDVTCADFSSSAEATNYMNTYGVTKLDRDGDGIACETLVAGETDYSEWDNSEWEWEPSPKAPDYYSEPGSTSV